MEPLTQQIQGITASLVAADSADLAAMARIHSRLLDLDAANKAAPTAGGAAIGTMLRAVESIVLRETSDPVETLEHIGRLLESLQREVDGAPSPAVAAAVAMVAAAPAAAGEHAAPAAAESVIAESDRQVVTDFINEANGHLDAAEAALLELESSTNNSECINSIFRSFHTIKGIAGFLGLKQIGLLAHAAESLLDEARQGRLELAGARADLVLESLDAMRTLLKTLSAALAAGRAQEPLDGLSDLIARLGKSCAGENVAAKALSSATEPSAAPSTPVAAAKPGAHPEPEHGQHPEARAGNASSSESATVKVGTGRLDSLVNLVGELLIAQSMVRQGATPFVSGNPTLGRRLAHLTKITRELQDLSMSMRMVPIRGVFQKMNRLVRDVARKAGKQVELVTIGDETELDRNVVEAVSDPLVHMVRNAVDHGIEPPQDRQAAGKGQTGRLELKAFHEGGSIVIQIRDDGRGLNTEKILRKAIAAGLVREGQQVPQEEIFQLIFHAGLSTADKITDVSGRGVGMDVVKRNIEALRGRIEIASRPGEGSTFTIRLPLTLAMIDGMLIRVNGARFIIPLTSIEQSIQLKPEQLSTVQGRGRVCMVRGALLPLHRLSTLLAMPAGEHENEGTLGVILHENGRRCCLLVDELLGQQQVVIKSLGDGIGTLKGISGGAILGDGTVSLIVEVPGLMDLGESCGTENRRAETIG